MAVFSQCAFGNGVSFLENLIDFALNKLWFTGDYQCVPYKSYLSPFSLVKLSLRLRQPIRIFSEFEREVVYSNVTSDHRSDKFWFKISQARCSCLNIKEFLFEI